MQVVDTPYLVDPNLKNFIPGLFYNDSQLELTAESLYRQRKLLFMYLQVLHVCWLYISPSGFCIRTRHSSRNRRWNLNNFSFVAGVGSAVERLNVSFPLVGMQMRERVSIDLEELISIIFLPFLLQPVSRRLHQLSSSPFSEKLQILRYKGGTRAFIIFPNRAALLQRVFAH